MSVKKSNRSANREFGFFNSARTSKLGKSPKTMNKMIPGIKKSWKGDLAKMDNGKPPSNLPDGETINAPPPPTAPNPRNARRKRWIFIAVFDFMIVGVNIVLIMLDIFISRRFNAEKSV